MPSTGLSKATVTIRSVSLSFNLYESRNSKTASAGISVEMFTLRSSEVVWIRSEVGKGCNQ